MGYPILAQVQPSIACNTFLKPPLAVLHSGINIRKLAPEVPKQLTKNYQFGPDGEYRASFTRTIG